MNIKSKDIDYKNLKKYNLIVLLTDHDYINYNLLGKYSKKIIDTRGRFNGDNIIKM